MIPSTRDFTICCASQEGSDDGSRLGVTNSSRSSTTRACQSVGRSDDLAASRPYFFKPSIRWRSTSAAAACAFASAAARSVAASRWPSASRSSKQSGSSPNWNHGETSPFRTLQDPSFHPPADRHDGQVEELCGFANGYEVVETDLSLIAEPDSVTNSDHSCGKRAPRGSASHVGAVGTLH